MQLLVPRQFRHCRMQIQCHQSSLVFPVEEKDTSIRSIANNLEKLQKPPEFEVEACIFLTYHYYLSIKSTKYREFCLSHVGAMSKGLVTNTTKDKQEEPNKL